MSGYEDRYGYYDDIDPFANTADSFLDEGEDEIEPWRERFYDERDDYEGFRDEVER